MWFFFHFKTILCLTNSVFNNKNICCALRNLKIHIFRVGPTAYLSMLSMTQIVFIFLFCYPCYVYFSPYICHPTHARWLQNFQAYVPVHRKSRGAEGSSMLSPVPFYKQEKLCQSSSQKFPSWLIVLNYATTSSRTAGKWCKFK